jgi:hypothetical protein
MEKSSIWTVGLGTLTLCKSVFNAFLGRRAGLTICKFHTAATSAFITGIYTAVKRKPNSKLLVAAAAVNSAITGATFFSTSVSGLFF